ncbi:MAG TPA: adenylate/guanylate cyclase domain-containing protein [Burkholderiales bacterium]
MSGEERRAILFADVCESTSIYETAGDAAALAQINRLLAVLEKQVRAAGGRVVKSLGDGVICVFDTADDAVRAACEMQQAAQELGTSGTAPLRIKVSCNYGPVVMAQNDVFGDTVNVCARLMSLANAEQVLSTRQTLEALSPGLRSRCRELYETQVRGREVPVAVCEVVWRGDVDLTKVDLSQEELGADASEWVLKVSYGGESYVVEPAGSMRIGREPSNDIVVPSEHASRQHARIFARDAQFLIADQSSNGTFLMIDGSERELRLRREQALLGDRGWIGLGKTAANHGDHVLRYRLERRSR